MGKASLVTSAMSFTFLKAGLGLVERVVLLWCELQGLMPLLYVPQKFSPRILVTSEWVHLKGPKHP